MVAEMRMVTEMKMVEVVLCKNNFLFWNVMHAFWLNKMAIDDSFHTHDRVALA